MLFHLVEHKQHIQNNLEGHQHLARVEVTSYEPGTKDTRRGQLIEISIRPKRVAKELTVCVAGSRISRQEYEIVALIVASISLRAILHNK